MPGGGLQPAPRARPEPVLEVRLNGKCPAETVCVPVSIGELIDKITILQIKAARIGDPGKRANVMAELHALTAVRDDHGLGGAGLDGLEERLLAVNTALWEAEDEIRAIESRRDFGERFVALARSVYLNNDERARVKKEINLMMGSRIVEEKSYL